MRKLQKSLLLCASLLLVQIVRAQNISGIINKYASVSLIDTSNCQTKLTVDTANQFLPGDTVLIIQMKGASIDSTNTINFGTILNYNECGNYEIATIQTIAGNVITLFQGLNRTYNTNHKVQLVSVPTYTNATVTAPLTCAPWNGNKGGVLALFVTNTLTLSDDINCSGKGFRGGTISNNPNGGCASSNSGYAFDLFLPAAMWNSAGGAEKGESITDVSNLLMGGRGHLASGGGGGNKHNTGGGGGGNFSAGGKGGNEMQGCSQDGNGGIGGLALQYSSASNKLFMGGGGGCGDINNLVGSPGTNGGGIIVLKAQAIVGNNHSIYNNGLNQTIQATTIGDGAGGGGAGGSVIFNNTNFVGNLTIQANGGDGGDQGAGTTYGCFGPGGGGGAGIVVSDITLPANVSIQNLPGSHGQILNTTMPCYGTPYGSTDGSAAAVSALTNFLIPKGIIQLNTPITVNLGPDTSICAGQSIVLNSGYPNYSKLWSTSDTSTSITVSTSGQYHVFVSDAALCQGGYDTIHVNVINPQTFSIPDQELCENDTINIQSPLTGTSYLWSTNMNTSSIQINQPGTYWLRVINPPCTNFTDTFNVISTSIPDISPIPDKKLCNIGQPITISVNTSSTQGNILWYDGGQQHVKTISTPGEYWVSFSNSCGSDTSYFNIENEGVTSLFVPNSFTPNGDLLNDALNIRASIPDAIRDFYFTIYNRYGERVFETNSLSLSWNGEYRNAPAPVGTYYWYLKGKSNCGEIFLKGDVTLLR